MLTSRSKRAACALLFSAAIIVAFQPALAAPKKAKAVKPAAAAEIKMGSLTLADAVAAALENSPRLQSAGASREAGLGDRQQAGLFANPELDIEAENFGGQGPYKGLDSTEVTYGVSQLIEIGGKRSARIAVAERGMDLAGYDYLSARLDLIRDVTQAFNQAVAAEEKIKLAEEQKKLAADVLETVTRRVNAAREPLIQKSKANVALATSRIAFDKAQREAETARSTLAKVMGQDKLQDLDHSSFYKIEPPANLDGIETALATNPDIARGKPAIARSEAALRLEKANAVPDPRLSVGIRDFRETGDKAFVGGIAIPFPVLNRNQGNIARARAEMTKTMSDQRAAEQSIGIDLDKSIQGQAAAYTQAETLRDSVLPEAEQAFKLSRQGYQAGKFTYLEVLDAERTLADARAEYIDALLEYHDQLSNVERLTAAHLPANLDSEDSHEKN